MIIQSSYAFRIMLSALLVMLTVTEGQAGTRETREQELSQAIDAVIATTYIGPVVPPASDFEFLRRVYLDLIGRSPTVEETQEFLRQREVAPNESTEIRERLIDELLSRDEFTRYYSKVLEVMFTERREVIGTLELRAFILAWLDEGRPINELCAEMLGGDGAGGRQWRAAGSFFINRNADPNLVTRDIGRIFFGRDVRCAQCHDHPLVSDYHQSEYFGILSFVNRTYLFQDEKRGKLPFLGEKGDGDPEFASVFRPQDSKSIAQPVLPLAMAMDAEPDFVDSEDAYLVPPGKETRAVPRYSRRQQLAVLATHPANESFNRNLANRLWANMMGEGVVHPVDMHHSDNAPSSAALLRLLADHLVGCNYDLRAFIRQIARSKTYQRSVHAPDLNSWSGPPGGVAALDVALSGIQDATQQLQPRFSQLEGELNDANRNLSQAQLDVSNLQQRIEEAKKQLRRVVDQRDKEVLALTDSRTKRDKQQELIRSLQAALGESEKVLQITPDDQEVSATLALLSKRLASAKESLPSLESRVGELQEAVEDANYSVDDQRNRIVALANRRLALGEFVVEARGVQRRLRKQVQVVMDQKSDYQQQKQRLNLLRRWLAQRDQQLHRNTNDSSGGPGTEDQPLDLIEQDLLESWRRGFGLRRVRGLSPEQLTGATYTALEMYVPAREKALADWQSMSHANPADKEDVKKRQSYLVKALAVNMWDTVEDLVVSRFSLAAGSPQDGFFATVDQALTIQNDPSFQNWLKPSPGNLVQRLSAEKDPNRLAEQLYLSLVCRLPDDEERSMVGDFLRRHSEDANVEAPAAVVQELVWGLLASAEFRFML